METTTKTILTIKTSNNRTLYVDSIDPFDWDSHSSRAAGFDHMTIDEMKEYIDNIDNFKFLQNGENFEFVIQKISVTIEDEYYTPTDTLIKTALHRLSEKEIIALGIEELGIYHKMKEYDSQFDHRTDFDDSYPFEKKSSKATLTLESHTLNNSLQSYNSVLSDEEYPEPYDDVDVDECSEELFDFEPIEVQINDMISKINSSETIVK